MNVFSNEQDDWTSYVVKCFLVYFVCQAVIGLLMFEVCWASTAKHREVNERRDRKFPEFRRLDKVHEWTRMMFYPGVLSIMTTRFFLFFLTIAIDSLIVSIIAIGHDYSKGPLKGTRKRMIWTAHYYTNLIVLALAGMDVEVVYETTDYGYWLGPDYHKELTKIKRSSTLISTHSSWCDGFVMGYLF